MSKERRPWSKHYDAEYLADDKITQMTPAEQGITNLLWSISRTQTDEPGVFIKDGAIMHVNDIARAVKPRCSGGGTRLDIVSKWVSTVLQVGPFKQRDDGAWYSPRIVRDVEEYDKQRTYGKQGAEKRYPKEKHYNGVNGRQVPATPTGPPTDRSEEEVEEEQSQQRARPRDHSANQPPAGRPTLSEELSQPAELERYLVRYRLEIPEAIADDEDIGWLRETLLDVTTDPNNGTPFAHRKRLQILHEFAGKDAEVVMRAVWRYRDGNGKENGKGWRYLLRICEEGAASETREKRNNREKKARGELRTVIQ